MRVLLSTIGSRGDVQPLVALASQLRGLGQEVRLCVPPDFQEWIDSLGFPVTPIGPEVRKMTAASPPATPGPALGRAAPSTGGNLGRNAIRDNHGGGAQLRHDRGCDSPPDRRSLGGRDDGNSLRLRCLLSERSAIAPPCATRIAACAGTDAGTRNG